MRSITVSPKGLSFATNDATSHTVDRWGDVWDSDAHSRVIVEFSGKRTTFTYDVQSRTIVEFPTGGRVTLAWCQSQMTSAPATMSQFAANIELRLKSLPHSTNAAVEAFLVHPESQCQVTDAATRALRAGLKRKRWLEDVVQHANLKLLSDLRRGKLVFGGDDPDEFVRWFCGAVRYAVIDSVKFCLRAFRQSQLPSATENIHDPKMCDPSRTAMLLELSRQVINEIERIDEPELREVMRGLLKNMSIRESAESLGISKAKAGKLRKIGCRLIAGRFGK